MFFDPEDIALSKLNPREELLWYGLPVLSKTIKTLKPILKFLSGIAVAFWGYAIIVLTMEVIENYPYYSGAGKWFGPLDFQAFKQVLVGIAGGTFFMFFNKFLPLAFRNEIDTIYVITNRRAFIIKKNQKSDYFTVVKQWGSGDVQQIRKTKHDDLSGDIVFVEELQAFIPTENGEVSRSFTWMGFQNVEDVQSAFDALQEWKKTHSETDIIDNNGLGFSLKIPHGWTANSFVIEPEFRDNTFLAIISGEMVGDGHLMKTDNLEPTWNTLILTKKLEFPKPPQTSRQFYLTILIEAGIRNELPELGEAVFSNNVTPVFEKLVKNPQQFSEMIKGIATIFEFSQPCLKDENTGKYKARYHANAKPLKLKNDLNNFVMTNSFTLSEHGLKFKHIYAYKIIPWDEHDPKVCLHIRLTFIAPDIHKEKFYKANHKKLNEIAESLKTTKYETSTFNKD